MIAEVQDLTRRDYELFRKLVYAKSGINLGNEKMQLVRARLGKRVRQGGFASFRAYYEHVQNDETGEALCHLIDAISTNTTHLFREIRHFELLDEILRRWAADKAWRKRNREVRIWSAACSSGEEPHSIAMVARDALQKHLDLDVRILATDISTKVLATAKIGRYDIHRVGTVPARLRQRYLHNSVHDGERYFELTPEVHRLITYARFNLMAPTFSFKLGFHIIFCRNVMIYFDRPTQSTLVNKYAKHMAPGGYLMIGHSETLNGLDHPLRYVEPTVYKNG